MRVEPPAHAGGVLLLSSKEAETLDVIFRGDFDHVSHFNSHRLRNSNRFEFAGISGAATDAWGCSYDKRLVVCAKVGGKMCNSYCNKQLKDKQLAKTCK